MNYVKTVRSTLKGGCNVNLSQRTVLYGPNGAGKSTVIQSIELATCGIVSDMEGREHVKNHSALARLFPADKEMFVDVELSDGECFTWSMGRKKAAGSFHKPSEIRPSTVRWPFQEIKGVLSGEPSAISAWLETRITKGSSLKDEILRQIPPTLRDHASDYIDSRPRADFLVLAKEAKSEARKLRTAATKKEKTIDSLLEGVSPPMLESDREDLKAELASLKGISTSDGGTQEEKDAKTKELSALVDAFMDLQNRAEAVEVDAKAVAAVNRLVTAGGLVAGHQEAFGEEMDCVVCGQGTASHIKEHKRAISAALSDASSAAEGIKTKQSLQREAMTAKTLMERAAKRVKAFVVREDTSDARDAIVSKLASDDAASRTWKNAETQREEVNADREKADILTGVSKALEKAGKALLEDKKEAFEQEVSSFLPPEDTFAIDLSSGRVGLIRGQDNLHTALSGAEWSRVLLALASTQSDSSTLCLLVPDDRGWDEDTLVSVMESLSASPHQIIIMSTVEPARVKGWSCIDVT